DGILDVAPSRGLGDVYKIQATFIMHAIMNVALHVIGLNVPILNNSLKIEPGNISQAIPDRGIKIMPATADTKLAQNVAMKAFIAGKLNNFSTKIDSITNPADIAHHENNRASKYTAGQTILAYAEKEIIKSRQAINFFTKPPCKLIALLNGAYDYLKQAYVTANQKCHTLAA
ncbi:hypothetical protein, partial [Photobacterium sanguinicancri]